MLSDDDFYKEFQIQQTLWLMQKKNLIENIKY